MLVHIRSQRRANEREMEEEALTPFYTKLSGRHAETSPWALGPIARIPPEILSRAFGLLASAPFSKQRKLAWSVDGDRWYDWLKMARVCRYWCKLVYHDPSLWRDVHSPSPSPSLTNVLALSGTVPLTLTYDGRTILPRSHTDSLQAALRAGRFKNLELLVRMSTYAGDTGDAFIAAFPYLHSLSLTLIRRREALAWREFFPHTASLSQLQELSLKDVVISWRELSRITSLQLLCLETKYNLRYSELEDVLRALSNMSQLRRLSLHMPVNCVDRLTGKASLAYSRSLPVATLGVLEKFDVSTMTRPEAGFGILLAHIRFPGTTSLEFHLTHDRSWKSLGKKLTGRTSLSAPHPIQRLYLNIELYGEIYYVRGRSASLTDASTGREISMPYDFEVQLDPSFVEWDGDAEYKLNLVLQEMELASVRYLSITTAMEDPKSDLIWRDSHGLSLLLPNVTELRIGGGPKTVGPVRQFLEDWEPPSPSGSPNHPVAAALANSAPTLSPSPPPSSPSSSIYDQCVFCNITLLELRNIIFELCEPDEGEMGSECVHSLLFILGFRAEKGGCQALQHLIITRCWNFFESDVPDCERFAAQVTWDGVERTWCHKPAVGEIA